MHCPCGREKMLANGLCASCYTRKRQDVEYFGGLRETVLERDGYRCRVCDAPGGRKREMIVHHRVPGKSVLALMISLCPGCHAKVRRTKAVLTTWPRLLLELWREQPLSGTNKPRLTSRLRKLLQSWYPSSMRRGSRLTSKNNGIHQDQAIQVQQRAYILRYGLSSVGGFTCFIPRLRSRISRSTACMPCHNV